MGRTDNSGGRAARHKAKGGVRRTGLTVLRLAALTVCGGLAVFAAGYAMTPIPEKNDLSQVKASVVYYADGERELGTFAAENRIPVKFADIPEHVRDAVVAAENKNFWNDQGVDPIGLTRAALGNATGTSRGGGSTITQQYVKLLYLTSERTLGRKLEELFIALKVNQKLSKQEILEGYLNIGYFGRGALGIQTASRAYFDKDAEDLTVTEGAVLASMLKAPGDYDPAENNGETERLERRFQYTLNNMAEIGAIEPEFAAKAELPELRPIDDEQMYEGPNGYILAEVKRELNSMGYSDQEINADGLRITTTIEPKVQKSMERALGQTLRDKDAEGLYAGGAAVRPGTGEVLAMYGGEDYLRRQWNDATQSKLEAGSAFEPFTLAASYEKGFPPIGRVVGVDQDWPDPYWSGELAIERSWPISMALGRIGAGAVVDAAVRAGIPADTEGLRPTPALALVAPIDMANAYATFAADGRRAERHLIAKVTTASGEVLYEHGVEARNALEENVVRDVTYALQGVQARTVGSPAAGSTGGHDDKTTWFVGYTPRLAASVAFYKDSDGDGVKEPLTASDGGHPTRVGAALLADALESKPRTVNR